jgi:predicted metal-dependent hydrolase
MHLAVWLLIPLVTMRASPSTVAGIIPRIIFCVKNPMPVEIDQIIRTKRKTIALIVRPDGTLLVRAPMRASNRSIQEFVATNTRWIEKTRTRIRDSAPPLAKQYVPGEQFEYLGQVYPLEIVTDQRKSLLLEEGKFKLAASAKDGATLVFERWYREQARQVLQERVELFAGQNGFRYSRIGVTAARTRWGSCSAKGALNFSWRLIQAPIEAVDYVVVHELVHTLIHNHSKKFWKSVEQILPDYRTRRKWLRSNGQRLLA